MIGSRIIGNIKKKFREEMNERKADKLSKQMAKKKARKVYREVKATETVKIAKGKAKSDAKKGGILKRISTSIAKNKKSTKKEETTFFRGSPFGVGSDSGKKKEETTLFKGSPFTIGNDSGKKKEEKARNVFEL